MNHRARLGGDQGAAVIAQVLRTRGVRAELLLDEGGVITTGIVDGVDRPVASTAIWVLPKIVGEVRFMDWTTAGHLRHPSWRGIRRDKLPGDL